MPCVRYIFKARWMNWAGERRGSLIDIILINPPLPRKIASLYVPQSVTSVLPLGLAYLAASLELSEIKVSVVDMQVLGLRGPDVLKIIAEQRPAVVGISSLVSNHGNGMRLAARIRENFPNIKVVMGGPHASFIAEEVLSSGVVDIVSLFESEETLPELMHALLNGRELDSVAGIAYTADRKVYYSNARRPIANLDTLPLPARHLFPIERYQGVAGAAHLITGRGCPFRCIFCSAGAIYGSIYRSRSPAKVVDEIEELVYRYHLTDIFFSDDTFTIDQRRAANICRMIINRKLPITWNCEARVDTVKPDLLRIMKEAGCTGLQFGVESGDNDVLRRSGKGITVDQILYAVNETVLAGINVACSLIIGHPSDTKETIAKTMSLARRLVALGNYKAKVHVKFALFTPLPGTPVYENPERYNLEILTRNWDRYDFSTVVSQIEGMTREEIESAFANACEFQRKSAKQDRGEYDEALS